MPFLFLPVTRTKQTISVQNNLSKSLKIKHPRKNTGGGVLMHQICRHIRTSGGRCRSVAIANQNFCYYHLSQRRPAAAHLSVDLPPLEDRGAIQIAISRVLSA